MFPALVEPGQLHQRRALRWCACHLIDKDRSRWWGVERLLLLKGRLHLLL